MKAHIALICFFACLLYANPAFGIGLTPEQQKQVRTIIKQELENDKGSFQKLKQSVRDDSDKQNQRLDALTKQIAETETTVKAQTLKINELTDKLNATRKLLDKNLEDISKLRKGADGTKKQTTTILLILVPIAIIVLLFASFFFWPRNQTGRTPVPSDSGARPKCPRCGWEHDPRDTVCKNPACKTQF